MITRPEHAYPSRMVSHTFRVEIDRKRFGSKVREIASLLHVTTRVVPSQSKRNVCIGGQRTFCVVKAGRDTHRSDR